MFKNLFKKALQPTKDSWFSKAMHLFDRTTIDESIWTELEEVLISADVGMETTEKLIERTRQRVKDEKLKDGESGPRSPKKRNGQNTGSAGAGAGSNSPPRVILVIGVNGSGKTTSIAKMAYLGKNEGKSVHAGRRRYFPGSSH